MKTCLTSGVVHWLHSDNPWAACGIQYREGEVLQITGLPSDSRRKWMERYLNGEYEVVGRSANATKDKALVTCKRCRRSKAWKHD